MRNEWNETVTPSVIAVNGSRFVVGRGALDTVSDDPLAAVFHAKRIIGRRSDDAVTVAERERHGGRIVAPAARRVSR